jgi:hypothetical protein
MTRAQKAKFDRLCELEPRLRQLYDEAKAVNWMEPIPCANTWWYGYGVGDSGRFSDVVNSPRNRLDLLVGYHVEKVGGPAELSTREAHNLALHVIYRALPDCDERCCA